MHVTVLGDRQFRLPAGWTKETVVTLVGDARIDASTMPGPDATVTCVVLIGDAAIEVAPGSKVTGSGFTLVGDRKIDVSLGDGPAISVRSYSLFGDLKVSEKRAV